MNKLNWMYCFRHYYWHFWNKYILETVFVNLVMSLITSMATETVTISTHTLSTPRGVFITFVKYFYRCNYLLLYRFLFCHNYSGESFHFCWKKQGHEFHLAFPIFGVYLMSLWLWSVCFLPQICFALFTCSSWWVNIAPISWLNQQSR